MTTILVADPDPRSVAILQRVLGREGYEIVVAMSGQEAFDMATTLFPALILLGNLFPPLDSIAVTQRLRTNPLTRTIGIIWLTGVDDNERRIQGLEAGADDFINKPFERVLLLTRIHILLNASLPPTSPSSSRPTPLILLVDDDARSIDILVRVLSREGYDLRSARNGVEAIQLAQEIQPDLILLDVTMPVMDGFEACRRLKADPATWHIFIVFVTGLDDNESRIRGLKLGGDDFINKPFERATLLARIRHFLRRSVIWDYLNQSSSSDRRHIVVCNPDEALESLGAYLRKRGFCVTTTLTAELPRTLAAQSTDLLLVCEPSLHSPLAAVLATVCADPMLSMIPRIALLTQGLPQDAVGVSFDWYLTSSPSEFGSLRMIEQRLIEYPRALYADLTAIMPDPTMAVLVIIRSVVHVEDRDEWSAIPGVRFQHRYRDILVYGLTLTNVDAALDRLFATIADGDDRTDLALTFGWVPCGTESVETLLDAVLQDAASRYWSQGGADNTLLLSLSFLQRGREWFWTERQQLQLRAEMLLHAASQREQQLRSHIEGMTAILRHDLNSGFWLLHDLLSYSSPNPPQFASGSDLRRNVRLCQIWLFILARMASGVHTHPSPVKLHEILAYFYDLIQETDSALMVTYEGEDDYTVYIDIKEFQAHIFGVAIAAAHAGASRLTFRTVATSQGWFLEIHDDGDGKTRVQALDHYTWLGDLINNPQDLWGLLLGIGVLQDRRLFSYTGDSTSFFLYSPLELHPVDSPPSAPSFAMLRHEVHSLHAMVKQLQQKRDQRPLEAHADGAVDVERVAAALMTPCLVQIESLIHHVLAAITPLANDPEEPTRFIRSVRVARYCALLTHNLVHILQGTTVLLTILDVNSHVQDVLAMLEHQIDHLHLQCSFPAEPLYILGVSGELHQILINIIKNASEAMPMRGTLIVNITSPSLRRVRIQIQDTGPGIPKCHQSDIFTLNFSTKGRGAQSGIGLYAVTSLVARMQGVLRIASAVEQDSQLRSWQQRFRTAPRWTAPGTRFDLEFPRVRPR